MFSTCKALRAQGAPQMKYSCRPSCLKATAVSKETPKLQFFCGRRELYVSKSSGAARSSPFNGQNLRTFRSTAISPCYQGKLESSRGLWRLHCECCILSQGLGASTKMSKFITFQEKLTELYTVLFSISASKCPFHWTDTKQEWHPLPFPPCQPECFPRVTSVRAQHKIILAGLYGTTGEC